MQRRRYARIAAISAAAVLAVTMAACSDTSGGDATGASGSKTIKLGFVAERSGLYQAYGKAVYNSTVVAVDQFNKAGGVDIDGVKYTFKLDVCDDNSEQTQVASCATKLVKDNGDRFVFGGLGQFGPIVAGITDPNEVIYFTAASAVANKLAQYKYAIAVLPALDMRERLAVEGLKKAYPDAKTFAMLGDDEATTTQTFPKVQSLIEQAGLRMVNKQVVPLNVTDYSAPLTAIKGSNPDVIYSYISSAERLQSMLQTASQLRASPAIFEWTFGCANVGKYTQNGLSYTGDTFAGADTNATSGPVAEFLKLYYARPGVTNPDPNVTAALWNYDFVGMLGEAMKSAGTATDTKAIIQKLNSVSVDGLNGHVTISGNAAVYGQLMCTSANGKTTSFVIKP
jgi:branched-chain amino acid transport system substrate-binding protein